MDSSDEQLLSSLSPRIKPNRTVKRKVPTLLSLKKHFRRSSVYDNSKATVPNHSLSIIELSSTESGSCENYHKSKSPVMLIDESDNIKNTIESDSDEEIVSPSPQKHIPQLNCLSTGKGKKLEVTTNGLLAKKKLFEIEKWVENVNKSAAQNKFEPEFLEATVLDYEDFKRKTDNGQIHVINSTLIPNSDKNGSDEEIICSSNENSEDDFNKSCEALLDNLYGESWRPKAEQILPSSVKKLGKTKKTKTEVKKVSNSKPIIEDLVMLGNTETNEKPTKSNHLLKILQTKRLREAIESPYEIKLNNKDTEELEQMEVRVKLNFNESDEDKSSALSSGNNNELEELNNTMEKLNFSDVEIIPLEERIRRKQNSDCRKKTRKCVETKKPISNFNCIGNEEVGKKLNFNNLYENDFSVKKVSVVSGTRKKKIQKKTSLTPSINSSSSSGTRNTNTRQNSTPTPSISSSSTSGEDKKINDKNIPNKRATRKKIINYVDSSSEAETDSKFSWKTATSNPGQQKILSFLESLSKNVPDSQCNISAKIFKKTYKDKKEILARTLFDLYNEKIFDTALPKTTLIEWNDRMLRTAGYCYSQKIIRRTGVTERNARIVLSSKVLDSADRLRDTLIHEMCHAATWIVDGVRDAHGNYWKAWTNKAKRAFPELPPIKTCHNFQVNTKYVYKCTGCGYSIGRHRKSLDIERKRCGYCLGKFEILINKVNKKGEQKTVPATPKKEATGFALFVKENYADFKSPSLKHADVMRLLSTKFNELKV